MSSEKRAEFDEFCRFGRNCTDIWRMLVNEGHTISVAAVAAWRRATYPTGEQAKILNGLAQVYDGLEGDRSLQTVEGIAITLIRQITQIYLQAPNKLDPAILKLFVLLPSLMRECRSSAAQREQLRFITDRAALEIAGGQRVCDILVQTFEGTSFEDALREAIRGAMLQIEQEAKSQQ
ncbi:hypothetical protein [Gloeocapsopsis dulcis]|uniref:Uncharacterized protein n=2 Tax=Gloeocapsopsis TaxID=693222 RepID=A0A6N8G7B5_9CHRO|nr:hypothetical protein [Gloeocapsopsis dulcis]MUL39436.1 hypothetical protein [Gloeocapsopsis dulcis AAB1 = 1H9]